MRLRSEMWLRFVRALLVGAAAGAVVALVGFGTAGRLDGGASTYAAAAAVGALAGALAGKPIRAPGGSVDALIRAAIGAFVVTVALFGARRFLGGFLLGAAALAILPFLGAFFALWAELDAFGKRKGASGVGR